MTLTRALVALILGAAVGCARPHANGIDPASAVEAIHHSRTYEVNPLNANDLRRSVSDQWRCGAVECKIGETQSRTTYTYKMTVSSARPCFVSNVHVKVETTITIPHWEPQGVTSAARRNWWSQIQSAVTRHEHQHVFIAEEGGKAVAAALMHLAETNCARFTQEVGPTVREELLRIDEQQQEFDRSEGPLQITAPPP